MNGQYSVDTSSLIELKHFPRDVFGSVWDTLEELIKAKRLFAPHEVFRELQKGDDEIFKWAKAQPGLFVDLDAVQGTLLADLLARFPAMAAPAKVGPHADPLVVALARSRLDSDGSGCHVVTEEKLKGAGSVKIPNVWSTPISVTPRQRLVIESPQSRDDCTDAPSTSAWASRRVDGRSAPAPLR
jgi:hypothetical protein